MNGILIRKIIGSNRVAGLMIRGEPFFFLADFARLFLGADNNLDGGLFNFSHCDGLFLSPCGKKRRFIEKIFKIRTCETDC